jgi:YD repeat-containing protein
VRTRTYTAPTGGRQRRTRTHSFDDLGRRTTYADTLRSDQMEQVCVEVPDQSPDCHFEVVGVSVQALGGQSYSYDLSGNRTDQGSVIPDNSNRVSSFAGYALQYDADGNLTRKYLAADSTQFNQRLAWNSLGELTAVVTTRAGVTTTASYGYDGFGRRVRKTVNGVTTRYLHDGDHLAMEVNESGTQAMRYYGYYPGVDQPHLMIVPGPQGQDQTYYYRLEAPGHVVSLTTANGDLANRYEYDPWGRSCMCWERPPAIGERSTTMEGVPREGKTCYGSKVAQAGEEPSPRCGDALAGRWPDLTPVRNRMVAAAAC